MYVKLDLERLREIAKITEPARKKNGEWRKNAVRRFRKICEKAGEEYDKFMVDLVENAVGPKKDKKIDITKIHFSSEALDIVKQILYSLNYVLYAPVLNEKLEPDVCYINEKEVYINPKKEGTI